MATASPVVARPGAPGAARGPAHRRPPRALALLLLAAALAPTGPAGAAPEPLSSLSRPDRPSPVFVMGAATFGGALEHDWLREGAAVSLLFRPDAAAEFFGPLHAWNTGLVLQAEWRTVAADRRLFGLAALLRRYARDFRSSRAGASPFVGVGFGGAEAKYPAAAAADTTGGVATGRRRWWLVLAEAGWESSPDGAMLFQAKAQWHVWKKGDLDYSGWSFHLGVGVPIPW